jgi:glucokinase
MSRGYLLAADVGGTKTMVALADREGPWPGIIAQHIYASRDCSALDAILTDFLARPEAQAHARAISAACFCVAGPVTGNSTTVTNLDWRIEADALMARFALPSVTLINDFAAAGLGISRLVAEDLATLQAGSRRERGSRLVIGAGTGLGVGWLIWEQDRYVAHASEAGHADFAPVDELQDQLLVYLRRHFGRVSYERVVSGPGLVRIFSFLQETGAAPSRQLQEAVKQRSDAAAVIGEFAVKKLDPLAVRALDLFVAAYGAFSGNLALSTLAHGGVYIAGGIAPKIATKLQEGAFIRAFLNKGRFTELLATMPVHVVMNPQVGLYGALLEAERHAA